MNRSQRSSDQKDGKISRDEDDPDVIITVTNRRAHDAHNPNAGRGGIAGCDITLSDDGAPYRWRASWAKDRNQLTAADFRTIQD